MDDGLYIALLNPSITLVLATAFLVLWLHQRQRPHIGLLALGYAASASGFLLQYFVLPVGITATKLSSNMLFLSAALCIGSGVIMRYGRPLPVLGFAMLIGGGLGALLWFLFVDPDLTWRIYVINFALGGISLAGCRGAQGSPTQDHGGLGSLCPIADLGTEFLCPHPGHHPLPRTLRDLCGLLCLDLLDHGDPHSRHPFDRDRAHPDHQHRARAHRRVAQPVRDRRAVRPAQPARLRTPGIEIAARL